MNSTLPMPGSPLGKRVGAMSVKEKHTFTDPDGIEKNITLRRVVRITERY